LYNNKSGQTVNSVNMIGVTKLTNSPIPNTPVGTSIVLKQINASPATPTATGGATDLTSEEPNPFASGDVKFQLNLSATTATGTIDWALIGY
jgi:hypothetical protein